MARSLAELAYSTQDDLLAGFYDTLIKNDQVVAALISNAAVTDRPTISYNQLMSLGTPVYADCSTEFTSQNISGSNVTVNLLTLAEQFDVCTIGQNLYSSFTDVTQSEVAGAVKAMGNKIGYDAVRSGNGSSAILGMGSVVTAAQTISANASFGLEDLDYLMDTVLDKSGPMAFIGSPAAVRAVVRELRSASALDVMQLMGTTFNVPSYLGVPLLKSENVATSTDLFLVNLDTGYKIFLGSNPEQTVGGIFGLQDLGNSQTKLAKLWRIYAHVAGVSLNTKGIAKLSGVA